jgi:hypothetical protein
MGWVVRVVALMSIVAWYPPNTVVALATAGRASAPAPRHPVDADETMASRLAIFQRALDSSSAGRAATQRAAVWVRGQMCVPAITASVLFYNRVPKTGSTAVKTATSLLRMPGVRMFSLTNEQRELAASASYRAKRMQAICDLLADGVPRVLISGHVHFIELTES